MKLKPFVLTLTLLAALSANAYQFSAQNEDGVTIYYEYNAIDNTAIVTKGNSNYTGEVKLPETVTYNGQECPVTTIKSDAFQNCTELTSVTIPESITSIEKSAFKNSTGLTSVNFNATNCESMGNTSNPVFEGCSSLTTVIFGNTVKSIPTNAFYNCTSLNSVIIPESVTTIKSNAFINTGLTTITIPESVTTIGDKAFGRCANLSTVNYNATNCTSMGSASSNYAVFTGCTSLSTLNIGENVESIPDNAFYGCTGLTTLDIPESVIKIGDNAFNGCSGLTTLTIGEGVKVIGNLAFNECTELSTVNFNATNCESMGNGEGQAVFYGCEKFTTLNIGNNVQSIPAYSFYGYKSLKYLDLGQGIKTIGYGAFMFDDGITSLDIPNSLTKIEDSAFHSCSGLQTTIIHKSLDDINIEGEYAFYDNQSILVNYYADQDIYPHAKGFGGLLYSMDIVVNLKIDYLDVTLATESDTNFANVYVSNNPAQIDPYVNWASANTNVATVTQNGVVSIGDFKGSTTITLTCIDYNNAKGEANYSITWNVVNPTDPTPTPKPTAIDELFVDEDGQTVEVYTLQGVRVGNTNLAPGVYVRRVGDKAEKIFVR